MLIALLIIAITRWPGPAFYHPLLDAFALLGWGAWHVARAPWGRPWDQYVFVTADFALLTVGLLYRNLLLPADFPP